MAEIEPRACRFEYNIYSSWPIVSYRLAQKSSTGLQMTLNSNYEISIHPDEKVLIVIKINTVLITRSRKTSIQQCFLFRFFFRQNGFGQNNKIFYSLNGLKARQ